MTRCTEVVVKFRQNNNGFNNQRVTTGDGPTATHGLGAEDDGGRLKIHFLDQFGNARKTLVFNMDAVQEYSLDGIAV